MAELLLKNRWPRDRHENHQWPVTARLCPQESTGSEGMAEGGNGHLMFQSVRAGLQREPAEKREGPGQRLGQQPARARAHTHAHAHAHLPWHSCEGMSSANL